MLTSHVQPAEAARLLWSQCSWMRNAMSLGEVCGLSRALAVVRLSPGAPLLVEGETATFVAIILDGNVEVRPGPSRVPPYTFKKRLLPPGTAIGYTAIFQGGYRGGDAIATSSPHVALISFAELSPHCNIHQQQRPHLATYITRQVYAYTCTYYTGSSLVYMEKPPAS